MIEIVFPADKGQMFQSVFNLADEVTFELTCNGPSSISLLLIG